MEDVVAVKLLDRKRGDWALLTWGRVYDRVDPQPLLDSAVNIFTSASRVPELG
jgi:hypothetical protein